MEPEKLKIKCPHCGAILAAKKLPGIESKIITCPVCNKPNKFTDFKPIHTAYKQQQTDEDDRTDIIRPKVCIGRLIKPDHTGEYPLQLGMNIVGRKAQTSTANVQIDTTDLYMSRSHAAIEVRQSPNGSITHTLFNMHNKNNTYVNAQLIKEGDRIILNGGEVLKLANTVLLFETNENYNRV